MTTFTSSTQSPARSTPACSIVPVFEGRSRGPGVRETGLADAYAAARLTGKKGETLLVTAVSGRGDRGSRPRRRCWSAWARRTSSISPRCAARSVARPEPPGGSARSRRRSPLASRRAPGAEAVQAAVEGLGLGAYRFDRYKTTSKDDDADLESVTVVGSAQVGREAPRATRWHEPTISSTPCAGLATW